MLCAFCGNPIRHSRQAGGWLHALPLAEFRVSHRERDDILRDPPRTGWHYRRPTHIHPATPGGR